MPRCLFCVLDWGLGHAARSVPIIKELVHEGVEVTIASNGRAGLLLQKDLPDLHYLELPEYGITYPFQNIGLNLSFQWPKIFRAIFREHVVVESLCKDKSYDFIISDNRYGCFSEKVKSIIITHQVNPATSNSISGWLSSKISRWLLKRFDAIWIPDEVGSSSLCGEMTLNPPIQAQKIGFLSRFSASQIETVEFDLLMVLSGPEPQRTHFEKSLIEKVKSWDGKARLVRGVTEGNNVWKHVSNQLSVVDYLNGSELLDQMKKSRVVLSRCGYSSLMDLIHLGKPSIVVPTPGQYEQETLMQQIKPYHPFVGVSEKDLDLTVLLRELENKSLRPGPYQNARLTVVIDNLLNE